MATAATPLLDYETFSASSERDVVNRVLTVISPDDSEMIDTYDEGRAPQTVEVEHRGSRFAGRVERLPVSDRRIKRKTLRPGLLVCVAAAVLQLTGCASLPEVLSRPVLDERVPSLRAPAMEFSATLVSRQLCRPHTTVNIWHEWGEGQELRISVFDPYSCGSMPALIQLGSDYYTTKGESTLVPFSEPGGPTSMTVSACNLACDCQITIPPFKKGVIHIVVEVDEAMEITTYDTFSPRQDRLLARMLRARDREARVCRNRFNDSTGVQE